MGFNRAKMPERKKRRCWNIALRTAGGWEGKSDPLPKKAIKDKKETNPEVFRFGVSPVRIHQSDG